MVGTAATPKSAVTVTGVALSNNSLILVTPQRRVPGVWVLATVRNVAGSRFTVFLNKAVEVGFPVAWIVVEKP